MEFDTYQGFHQGLMTEQDFYVKSMKFYELGQIIHQNNDVNKCVLTVRKSEITGEDTYKIFFENEIDHSILNPNVEFDKGIAYHDRISFCNIPSKSNVNAGSFVLMSSLIGSTRGSYDFKNNEPFILNLFSMKNNIMRISLVYDNPERVLEFDIDYDMNRVNREQTKAQLLSLMFHKVLELGHKSISYPEIIKHANDGFNAGIDKNQLDSILFTLNTISPKSFDTTSTLKGLFVEINANRTTIEDIIRKLH